MSYDHALVEEVSKRRRDARIQDALPALRTMQAQSPVMSALLTGNVGWDRYLSFLQNIAEGVARSKDYAQQKQNDPTVWDPQAMAKFKSDYLKADAMLEILDVVMKLPKALIEDGDRAAEMVKEFERTHESADKP